MTSIRKVMLADSNGTSGGSLSISMRTSDKQKAGADITAIEHPTLKAPYEVLNKKYRTTQKVIDREVSHINQSIKELRDSPKDLDSVHRALDHVVENLQALKRKADESMVAEQDTVQVCKKRLEHLKGIFEPADEASISAWKDKRFNRLLIDHLLRAGFYETATKLSQQSQLASTTNIDLFMIARQVECNLKERDTSKCLAWCHENKTKLRKFKSTLEIRLRQQEFIELVKKDRRLDAIAHARKYLTNVENDQREDLEHIMGLLAHPLDTKKEPYRSLLDESRWSILIEQFKKENYNLLQLSNVSLFSVVLQAGLSALKTPHCYNLGQRNPECPVCSPSLNELAKGLPYPHCSQSRLICSISGRPMNEHNPPMMLPNGYIYGELSLREMAARSGKNQVQCPKTRDIFNMNEAEKVYVM